MANIVGIDLGTTYSVIARLDETGRAEVIRDDDGNNLVPSAVEFQSGGVTLVGYDALEASYSRASHVARAFKREMGSEEHYSKFELSPTELSALVLTKLKTIASNRLGSVDAAVITVPANFTNSARVATIAAGKRAGLPVAHIVNEPTAAAMYYAFVENISGTVAVYDFGGGTFDVSIVKVTGTEVDVLASQGAQRLGGEDLEEKLLGILIAKYRDATGHSTPVTAYDLLDPPSLEDLKKVLSRRESKVVRVEAAGGPIENITITRDEFSNSIGTLITKAEMLFEAALDEAALTPTDLDHVVLVGGSTRVPAIRDSVRKLAGKEPVSTANVDEVVALGAALYAGLKSEDIQLTEAQQTAVGQLALNEVCNHFFGTTTLSHDEETQKYEDRVSILIEKNTKIPVSVSQSYYTVADGQQNVNCTVTQSVTMETDPRWVTKVAETTLGPLPAGRPAGQEVRVTFSYDSNQVMKCEFLDVASGASQSVVVDLRESDGSDSGLDIDRFLVE